MITAALLYDDDLFIQREEKTTRYYSMKYARHGTFGTLLDQIIHHHYVH